MHPDLIELQLAHAERNEVRAAYNRAQRLPERRTMMQSWADYLDRLREGRIVEKPFVDPHHSPDVDPGRMVALDVFRTDTRGGTRLNYRCLTAMNGNAHIGPRKRDAS